MTTPHPTRIARAQRKPETFRAYRVDDVKPPSRIDWEMVPLEFSVGLVVLLLISTVAFAVLACAVGLWICFKWWALLVAAGIFASGWVVWLIGKKVTEALP